MNRIFCCLVLLVLGLGIAPVAFAIVDNDSDGMSDLWTALYSGVAGHPDEDPDHDGQTNFREARAGTNPLSAASRFITTTTKDANDQVLVVWADVPGKGYTVQESHELVLDSWFTPETAPPTLANGTWTYETGFPPEQQMMMMAMGGGEGVLPVLEATVAPTGARRGLVAEHGPLRRYDLQIEIFDNGLAALQWFEREVVETTSPSVRRGGRTMVESQVVERTYRLLTDLDLSFLPSEGVWRDRQSGYELTFRTSSKPWFMFDLYFDISNRYNLNRYFGWGLYGLSRRNAPPQFYAAPFADLPHGGYSSLGEPQEKFLTWLRDFSERHHDAIAEMQPPSPMMLMSLAGRELAPTGDITTSAVFWRVVVEDKDTDGDGLTDWEELQLGTNPENPDTDGDGMGDGSEFSVGLNPLDNGSGSANQAPDADPDQDGLTNAEEAIFGTSPFGPDADNDQTLDGQDAMLHDANFSFARVPEPPYALIDLGPGIATEINALGQVLVYDESAVHPYRLWVVGSATNYPITWDLEGDWGYWEHLSNNGTIFNFSPSDPSGWFLAWCAPTSGLFGLDRDALPIERGTYAPGEDTPWAVPEYLPVGESDGYFRIYNSFSGVEGGFVWTFTHSRMVRAGVSGITPLNGETILSNVGNVLHVEEDAGPYTFVMGSEPNGQGGNHTLTETMHLAEGTRNYKLNGQSLSMDVYNGTVSDFVFTGLGHPVVCEADRSSQTPFPTLYWHNGQTVLAAYWPSQNSGGNTVHFKSLNKYGLGVTAAGEVFINGRVHSPSLAMPGVVEQYNPYAQLVFSAVAENFNTLIGTVQWYDPETDESGNRAVMLFPLSLTVDNNRDGTIDTVNAGDRTTPAKPFVFWVNDDDDEVLDSSGTFYTEIEEDDFDNISGSTHPKNFTSNTISCKRDLEDFARLWINVGSLQSQFASGNIVLGFKWKPFGNVSFGGINSPAIKLFRAYEANGGGLYLTNNTTAAAQVAFGNALADVSGTATTSTIVAPTSGEWDFVLHPSVFSNLTEANAKVYFLFEGCHTGKGELQIVLLKPNGGNYTKLGGGPGVCLDLQEPYALVEAFSCGISSFFDVEPSVQILPDSPSFPNPAIDSEKDYVLFIHGYNMGPIERRRWTETTYKRLYWLGYRGRVGGFLWPCSFAAGEPFFDDSENSAWRSAVRLKEHLVNLKNRGFRVHMLAHSQGNVLATEALRLWRQEGNTSPLVRTYVASQAAIPSGCYVSNATAIGSYLITNHNTGMPDVYTHYWKAGDDGQHPATWPQINPPYMEQAFVQSASGSWANYYNSDDYALTGDSLDHPGWQIDQRLKPANPIRLGQGHAYSSSNGFTVLDSNNTPLTFPADRYEIFSYAAASWTMALGTRPSIGVFNGATDLKALYGYSLEHRWHSAQFRSYNAVRWQYWNGLLLTLGIQPLTPPSP